MRLRPHNSTKYYIRRYIPNGIGTCTAQHWCPARKMKLYYESVRTGSTWLLASVNNHIKSRILFYVFLHILCVRRKYHSHTCRRAHRPTHIEYRQQSSHIRSIDAKIKSRQGIGDIETESERCFSGCCVFVVWKLRERKERERKSARECMRQCENSCESFTSSLCL